MIERKFVAEKMKEFEIEEHITSNLRGVGHSHTKVQRTPLGEKIVIYAARPGLVVGKKGQNIKQLTKVLKKKFNLENPQIELSEVHNISLDAKIVAENIATALEKYGTAKFKGIGHKVMQDVMDAGALGIELVISGKIPSARAKTWRFYTGYLKKCGDVAIMGVKKAYAVAKLKSGIVGIKVKIMPPEVKLPDRVELRETPQTKVEEVKQEEKPKTEEAKPKKRESKKKEKEVKEEKDAKEDGKE